MEGSISPSVVEDRLASPGMVGNHVSHVVHLVVDDQPAIRGLVVAGDLLGGVVALLLAPEVLQHDGRVRVGGVDPRCL